MDRLHSLVDQARTDFQAEFGGTPEVVAVAPGRVNLIGEHTDYNDGFVMPVSIDRYIVVAASRHLGESKVVSSECKTQARFSVEEQSEMFGWTKFPAGIGWSLRQHGASPSNVNAVIVSDLPSNAGLSSSAALELAFLTVWNRLDDLGLSPLELATIGQLCEHQHIGVNCGLMDQLASALGREDCAMQIDVQAQEIKYFALPKALSIVVCQTGKDRTLTTTGYNERKRECDAACAELGIAILRDATEKSLARLAGNSLKRARHVVTENTRCLEFAKALELDDRREMGRLMSESHTSLRDDYEVSCPELDAMAEAAWSSLGCIGARMTGAGFGGSCVALVESDMVLRFMEQTDREYRQAVPSASPRLLACKSCDGARLI